MDKATIFFSHSSRDSKAIIYLKNLIQEKTGSMLNIFLSSDGQSIPFGTNWIHRIESGLENSIIMFVFVTPSSIKSNWIYFESGFAYSKKVRVIPIGVGIEISDLKPPLNLLQGFNLSSEEGINNIIKIVNDECDTTFQENSTDKEYNTLLSFMGFFNSDNSAINAVRYFETEIYSYTSSEKEEKIEVDVDYIFEFIKREFSLKKFEFASLNNQILFNGLKAEITKSKYGEKRIIIRISADSFETHIEIVKEILKASYDDKEMHFFNISLNEDYEIVTDELKLSSIVSKTKDIKFLQNTTNLGFSYQDLRFHIVSDYEYLMESRKNKKPILRIVFDMDIKSSSIFSLINALVDLSVIYKIN